VTFPGLALYCSALSGISSLRVVNQLPFSSFFIIMTTRWIIGLASGSSADGVEAVLLQTEDAGLDLQVKPVHALHMPYPRDLRELLLRVGSAKGGDVRQVSLLHRLLGETFAAAALQVADRASFPLYRVQCLGCPGHTIWHDPDGRFPSTLALGMAAVVAERTGVTTVYDFRSRDMAAGGQGAQLTALVDYLLFRHGQENRLLIHLGGMARVVFLPAGGRVQDVVGFEIGPCNRFLDSLMRELTSGREAYDSGGKHAVQGCCIDTLLQHWLEHPHWQRRPPKSLPRQGFAEELVLQAVQLARQNRCPLHDLLCTATHLVARGITQSLQRFLPRGALPARVFLSGGGTRNGFLWRLLEQQLPGITLEMTDAVGIPAEARKALAFGILAALTVDGVPANLPSATGAASARLLGSLVPGSSVNWARCLDWMASQNSVPVESWSED
jgi:anhydro-N-acetylmuramic acid kinase